jgi:uncharacterized membrane protein
MIKPEDQQPSLGRNPNRLERWESVNAKKVASQQSSSSQQTGVRYSESERDALQTGVWNPSRQKEAKPAGNLWVLLAIVTVCSLSSFAVFQSLLGPRLSNRAISARVDTAPRALPPAVVGQVSTPNAQADEVAASAVTFDSGTTSGTTAPVQTGQTASSSTLIETTPKTATLPASQIQLSQVDSIAESGGQPVLRFKDGSSLNVDAFTLGQLPSDVRLRITYSRGRDGP